MKPLRAEYDVAIAGAGIMGLSCGLELARDGAKVVILDPHPPGLKASWAAAGILVTRGSRHPLSAFRRFYLQSIAAYPAWLAALETESGMAIPYTEGGDYLVFDCREENGLQAYRDKVAQLEREEAVPWRESRELPAFLLPFSASSSVGKSDWRVLHFENEAYVHNRILLEALIEACRKLGVRFWPDSPAEAAGGDAAPRLQQAGEAWQIDWQGQRIQAGHLLIASGAWSRVWLQELGWDCALTPVKGQVALIEKPWASTAMLHFREDLYLIPRGNHLLIGATTEPGIWQEGFTEDGRKILEARLQTALPRLNLNPVDSWSGFRPRTKDRLPLMGALPGHRQAWLCTGHYKSGISMAPLAGKCLSAAIQGRRPAQSLEAFDPGRKGALHALSRA